MVRIIDFSYLKSIIDWFIDYRFLPGMISPEQIVQVLDVAYRKVIQFFKHLTFFNSLSAEDEFALVKGLDSLVV